MYYRINKEDGYIHSVVQGVNPNNANCTETEYKNIKTMLVNAPLAPDGFYYRLKENLEWELCEMSQIEPEATEADYREALEGLGVNFNA